MLYVRLKSVKSHSTPNLLPIHLPPLAAVLTRVKLIPELLPSQLQSFRSLIPSLKLPRLLASASAIDTFLGCPSP